MSSGSRSEVRFPALPLERSLGVGLDLRYGDPHGFEHQLEGGRPEEGDRVAPRVRAGAGWSTLGGQLSFNATAALMQQFSAYWGPDDEKTSVNAQTGLQQRDVFTTGVLQASYAPTSWFFLTVGTQTFQPLYTSTRNGVRVFPFWDFTSAANNFSSVFVDTTFMF